MPNAYRLVPDAEHWDGRSMRRVALCLAQCALCLGVAACGARHISFPTDPGQPFSDYAAVHATISAACSNVRTLTAELALSGRAGEQRLRGRVLAGFERPSSMRLEGVAPFGPPGFILVARPGEATLLLPRDNAVLRGEPAAGILGALTGVSLAPADLQAVLTGCVEPSPRPATGRVHANGWVSIDLAAGAVLFVRRQGAAWQLAGASREGWDVEYSDWQGDFPRSVRLRSSNPQVPVDLTASVSQLEANVELTADAFAVNVPAQVESITLEELRSAGPLRGDE